MTTVDEKFNNKYIGKLGETIAREYLQGLGHKILDQNVWKRYGELDIISECNSVVHFIEVKTVSHATKQQLFDSVTRATWLPEDRVNTDKLKHIQRSAESWIDSQNYSGLWQIDVVAVRCVPRETFASVKIIENIIE